MTVECKDCILETFCVSPKVGLVHSLDVPADVPYFIFEGDELQESLQNRYNHAFNNAVKLIELLDVTHVQFYPGSLTVAALGAIDGFRACGVRVDLLVYNPIEEGFDLLWIRQEYNL